MTRPSPQKLSAMHRRRVVHLPRAQTPTKVIDATPTPKTTAPVSVVGDKTKAAPENSSSTSAVLPLVSHISLPPLLGQGTTSLTSSSTVSTTAASVTPSVTTYSSIPPITTATSHTVVQTTARFSTSALTPTSTPTSTATAQASNGLSTAALIGGIGGALGGTILLTVIIAFFLRRWRKKQAAKNAFDASQFRRTSNLLNEEDNTRSRPRPPTMIGRRNVAPTTGAASLSSLSAAYPYNDQQPVLSFLSGNERAQSFAQHGANQAHYGAVAPQSPYLAAGNQFGSAPNALTRPNPYIGQGDSFGGYGTPGQGHEQSGYGAPPIPGSRGPGTYAPYGVDPRYPQYQHYQQKNQQYPRFGQSLTVDTVSGASLTRQESVSSLVNPFSPLPVPTNLEPTEGSDFVSTSTSSSSNAQLTRGASFVTRQSQEAPPPAYPNGGVYTDMKNAVKMLPSTSSSKVVNGNSDSTVPATKTADTTTTTSKESAPEPRPVSAYTLYNADDAYGGM